MFPFFDFDIVFPCTSSFSSSISPADLNDFVEIAENIVNITANGESNEEVGGSDNNGDEADNDDDPSHDDEPVSSQANTEEVGGSDNNGDEAGKDDDPSHDDEPVSSQANTKKCCAFDGCSNETIGGSKTCSDCCLDMLSLLGGSDNNGDEAGKEDNLSNEDASSHPPVSSQAHTKNCCVFDGCKNETIGTLITCSECCVESTGEIVDTIKTLADYMTELGHDDAVKKHLDSSLSGSELNFKISDNTACSCGCGKPLDRGNVSCTTSQCQMRLNTACCVVGSQEQSICSTCRHRLACFREAGINIEYAKTHFLSFSLPEEKTMKVHQKTLKQLSTSVTADTATLYTLPTGIPITKGEVDRLVTPDVWLNDQVLEAFVYILMESQKQAKYENKPFSDKKVLFLVVLYLYIFRQK